MQSETTPHARRLRRPRVFPRLHAWRVVGFASALVVALGLLGGSTVPALQQKWRAVDITVQAWDWDLVNWEVQAIREKLTAQFTQTQHLPAPQTPALVRSYLAHAQEIAELEDQIDALYAEKSGQTTPESDLLETKLTQLRQTQNADRPEVEQILQTQIGQLLNESGLQFFGAPFPPVWFTFTEPPKKLVVSPRSRIATAYYAMLDPALPAQAREEIETSIYTNQDLSAYVAEIGGLGAYPTQVVDRAPLPWILSTVAHEWTHNYLTLFPLGLRYDASPELTILNETVAEIVGDEVGAMALARYYPELVKEFPGKDEPAPSRHSDQPPAFDFRKEMRQTRETVEYFPEIRPCAGRRGIHGDSAYPLS